MSVGHEHHGGVPVAVTVALCRFHKPLDLGLGQVFPGSQLAVGGPPRRNCSFYGGWRDQLEVRFGHSFRLSAGRTVRITRLL